MTVGEEEEAGACIHLKGQRDVGKLILRAAENIGSDDEITMIVTAITMRMGQCAADIETAADKPVETVAAGCLVHEIGVEGEHNRHRIKLIVKDETVTQVKLDCEMVGGEGLEGGTIHKTECTTDGIVVRSGIAANLSHGNRA